MKPQIEKSTSFNDLLAFHRSNASAEATDVVSSDSQAPKFFENTKLALTITEAALALGVSPRTLERFLKTGLISFKRIGRRILIPKAALETWLQTKE